MGCCRRYLTFAGARAGRRGEIVPAEGDRIDRVTPAACLAYEAPELFSVLVDLPGEVALHEVERRQVSGVGKRGAEQVEGAVGAGEAVVRGLQSHEPPLGRG